LYIYEVNALLPVNGLFLRKKKRRENSFIFPGAGAPLKKRPDGTYLRALYRARAVF
jgi:hypothetical protein